MIVVFHPLYPPLQYHNPIITRPIQLSQRDIAQILQVSSGTINKDLSILREQAKSNIKLYIEERLPEEYE